MATTATAELTRFVYLVDGEPSVGTVEDYAKALEQAHYAGFEVSQQVWTFSAGEPKATTVATRSTGYDEDDVSTLTVLLFAPKGPEVASVRIDGRA